MLPTRALPRQPRDAAAVNAGLHPQGSQNTRNIYIFRQRNTMQVEHLQAAFFPAIPPVRGALPVPSSRAVGWTDSPEFVTINPDNWIRANSPPVLCPGRTISRLLGRRGAHELWHRARAAPAPKCHPQNPRHRDGSARPSGTGTGKRSGSCSPMDPLDDEGSLCCSRAPWQRALRAIKSKWRGCEEAGMGTRCSLLAWSSSPRLLLPFSALVGSRGQGG